jgi:hypothetical protein
MVMVEDGTDSGLSPMAGLFISSVELLVLPECKVCVLHAERHCVKAYPKVPEPTAMTKNGK